MSSLIKLKLKNNKLLMLVIMMYLLLLLMMPSKAVLAFNNSLYYVKEMLLIMPVIMMLTSLIEAWVPKKTIENSLGRRAGAKGFIFSFLLGSFSAGPIYAAFPICKMLLKRGASIANIVIILSTWAVIKIPMLANEAKFLGPKFMAVRWLLTTISIFIMAFITEKLVTKEHMPLEKVLAEEKAVLYVNQSYCVGCGLCAKILPDRFAIENAKAKTLKAILKLEENKDIKLVMEKCPAKAIQYK